MSIALNVAEGKGRWTARDQGSFIVNARASAQELEATLYLAEDLDNGLLTFYRKT